MAREHAHAEWMASTDPNALTAALPLSFKDAMSIAIEHGGLLGDGQAALVRRLKSVPSTKAARAMRQALRTAEAGPEVLTAITEVLDRFGIQQAEKVEPLPPIEADDIRLVAWMAVTGTKGVTASASGGRSGTQ
jgi:hypothetical protein